MSRALELFCALPVSVGALLIIAGTLTGVGVIASAWWTLLTLLAGGPR